jgi:hypothetical protein
MKAKDAVFYLRQNNIKITEANLRFKFYSGKIKGELTKEILDFAIENGIFKKSNRPNISEEKSKEIVDYFLKNKNNSTKQMAAFFDVGISTINHCIDNYFKSKKIGFKDA